MLLQRLTEHGHRLDLAPPMYQLTEVHWFVDLDTEGSLLGFVRADPGGEGRRRRRAGKRLHAPHALRASAVKAKLLTDNAEYVLGLARERGDPDKVVERHRAFVDLIQKCAARVDHPALRAVRWFYESATMPPDGLPEDLEASDTLTFRVGDTLVIDLPEVREFWVSHTEAELADESGAEFTCIVCGERKPIESRLQFKLKGVPGGQPSGTSLISANEAAFESYGLKASQVAPTCRTCGELFNKAANALLRDTATRLYVGPLVYVFWTRQPEAVVQSLAPALVDPAAAIRDYLAQKDDVPSEDQDVPPEPDQVRELLQSIWTGRERTAIDEDGFYAVALSGSGGRAVVRDWVETTVGQARRNIAGWFRKQSIVDWDGSPGLPVSLYKLLAAAYREVGDKGVAQEARALARAALVGTRLPDWLIYRAVSRARAEQRVTRPRAALIKMILAEQLRGGKENRMEQLDDTNRRPAYVCGRLLAEIEAIQRAALPGIKATLIDRYYGAASSAPASVFGNLLRGSQSHLGKLRRDKPGAYSALDGRLQDIMSFLPEFPATLDMKGQALFALGYYHQKAADRKAARERSQEKRERGQTAND